ncbi:MAG: VCBS repeat-containing protein [bacterium]
MVRRNLFGPTDTAALEVNRGSDNHGGSKSWVEGIIEKTAWEITAADLDGVNGNDPAVSLANGPARVAVLLNDRSGGFTEAATSPEDTNGVMITSANFDGDDDIDLATGGRVLLNDGTGDFTMGEHERRSGPLPQRRRRQLLARASFPLAGGRYFGDVHIGDVDGDGRADVLAGEVSVPQAAVAVFLSKSRGRFKEPNTSPEAIAGGAAVPSLAAGKFDRRKHPDIAATSGYSGALSILLSRSPVR